MKKGVAIVSAIAAAVILGGCAQREPMPPSHTSYQAGPSSKLGHHCVHHHHHKKSSY